MIWFGWVLWHINHCRLFNAKSSLYISIKHIYMICKHILQITILNKSELFFVHNEMVSSISMSQFNISHLFAQIVCSIWPIDRTLSGATTLDQSGPGSHGNERVFHIPQISKIGASPSDSLISYPGYSLRSLTPLQRWSQCILKSPPTGLLYY